MPFCFPKDSSVTSFSSFTFLASTILWTELRHWSMTDQSRSKGVFRRWVGGVGWGGGVAYFSLKPGFFFPEHLIFDVVGFICGRSFQGWRSLWGSVMKDLLSPKLLREVLLLGKACEHGINYDAFKLILLGAGLERDLTNFLVNKLYWKQIHHSQFYQWL